MVLTKLMLDGIFHERTPGDEDWSNSVLTYNKLVGLSVLMHGVEYNKFKLV
jgi:hypothetical protein